MSMPTDPTGEMPAPLTMSSLRETVIRKAYYMDSEIVRELFTEIEALRALKRPVLTREQIMDAVARGWERRQAASTIMDPVLAATITSEVMKLLEVIR